MDTSDTPNSNLPARFAVPSSLLPAPGSAFSGDLATTTSHQINSRTILRGVIRHWWLILLLWLGMSTPIVYVIQRFVKPTFEAYSILRIEPAKTEVFGSVGRENAEMRSVLPYLQTQVNLLSTDNVLDPAIADSTVVNLAWIKQSEDPKADLRKYLLVKIVDDAYLIRVALELADGEQAAVIVNAVVNSYLLYNTDYNRQRNATLKSNLTDELRRIQAEIEKKRNELREYYKKGTVQTGKPAPNSEALKGEGDATQPVVNVLTEQQIQGLVERTLKNNIDLGNAEAALKVLEERAASQATGQGNVQELDNPEIEIAIQDEFRKDPEVAALVERIRETRKELDHNRSVARQGSDPSLRVTRRELERLTAEYEKLWPEKRAQIRKRLTATTGALPSTNILDDQRMRVRMLRQEQQNLAQLYDKVSKEQHEAHGDTFEAAFLNMEVNGLMKRTDLIRANLTQLEFDSKQDTYRVGRVTPATAPKTATNNKHIKYMLAAAVGVLFMLLGLFMLLEIRAERIDDPDVLSTRVRSEVYALPPLPTTRSMRKLSAPKADDQIEQFVQRLDHLRFAVCGNTATLGKGRCVLITSAVGGEGKTILAAQLAARCGEAGMSTLLIDADLRRTHLCTILDVPEGLGLSDVLQDLAPAIDVVIPVQGGTFDLLSAGTPIQDTKRVSRVLQNQRFGFLISQLRERYDLIIIDSPPVLPVPDALVLGQWADGAVLAARYDISRFPQVERARRQLNNAGIAILGTVINGMRHSDSYYGRYSYSRRRTREPNSSNTI